MFQILHILSNTYFQFLKTYITHPSKFKVVTQRGLNFHFPND